VTVEWGKPARAAQQGAASAVDADPSRFDPGKTTLAQQQQSINNRYIEGKEHCATPGASGCTLLPEVRARLVSAYQRKVRIAEAFYVQALGEIGLERLIQRDEELPAIVTLAIDLLGNYVGGVVTKSLLKLRNAAPREFLKTVDNMIEFQTTGEDGASPNAIKTLLDMTSPQGVELIIKTATDFGKKGVKKQASQTLANNEKEDTLNYIDELKKAAAISFEHLDLDIPGVANDGQMIAAFHAFDAEMGNDVPSFKAALKQKIERYLATVAKVGRAAVRFRDPLRSPQEQKLEPQQDFRATMRDTQVVWVTILGDPVPRLYYAKVDYQWSPTSPQPALDDKFVLTRPVDLEFTNTALLRHQEKWGLPPQTRVMTRAALAQETRDDSVLMVPRIDLSPVHKARSITPAPAAPAPQPDTKPSVVDAAVDVPSVIGGDL
jgi:hypothetical protein